MSMSENPLRIAVVGAGGIAQHVYLPLLSRRNDIRVELLVETNLERGQALARTFAVPMIVPSIQEIPPGTQAALVLLPHALHAQASVELLRRRLHVLVEKPMALTAAECREMIDAARKAERLLAVGLMRRFSPLARWVKALVISGRLGAIRSFEASEGSIYGYKCATDSFFRRELAGGGVLMDTGAHVLDLCFWWLGYPERFEYHDDAYGGVEADCEINMCFAGGAVGHVQLSRTRNLPAVMRLLGEHGEVEFSLFGEPFSAAGAAAAFSHEGIAPRRMPQPDMLSWFERQIDDWVSAIHSAGAPLVSGEEGMRSVAFLEACYRERQPLDLPWLHCWQASAVEA
jgi:predicted dehydrogenase